MGTSKRLAEKWEKEQEMDKTCQICGEKAEDRLSLTVELKRHFLQTALLSYDCVCNSCVMAMQKAVGIAVEITVEGIRGEL